MKKRKFIKTIAAGTGALLTTNSFLSCNETVKKPVPAKPEKLIAKPLPANWMWLRPSLGKTDDQWKIIFAQIKNAGIDAVLPQIYSSHETLFDHPTLPVKERLLERLIPLAHQAGLEIHAWMWTMPLNNPDLIEKHPDWFAVNRNGQPAHIHPAYVDYYKFMCPCHPEVQDYVAANVEALAKIEDLDGIHLDYVRLPDVILAEGLQPKYNIVQDKEYPEYDYSYSDNCRNQFKAKYNVDPLDLPDPTKDDNWRQFRYDAISHIVNDRCVPIARKFNKKITAAVFPNWESVRQQWHTWDLDAFLPMLYHNFYNAEIDWIGEQTKAALERLKHKKPIYSGLFIPQLSPAALADAIDISKDAGAKGTCLFAFGSMESGHWEVLTKKLAEKKG